MTKSKNKDDESKKTTAPKSEAEQGEPIAGEKPADKKTPLEKLQEEHDALNDKLLRQFAEFDNYKKRTAKEKQELVGYTKSLCFKEVLGVVDNFERALLAECKDEEFKKGMSMIFTQLVDALSSQGIEEIKAIGETFDPEIHNAINQVEDENFGENTVCNVMQKGYKIGDKVIRHSMVVVANP